MEKPVVKEISDVEFAFPAHVVGTLLPVQVPAEFQDFHNPWCEIAQQVFYQGGAGLTFHPKKGINPRHALRMIAACLRSFEPSHEQKIAGVAYLMATFFEKVEKTEEESDE